MSSYEQYEQPNWQFGFSMNEDATKSMTGQSPSQPNIKVPLLGLWRDGLVWEGLFESSSLTTVVCVIIAQRIIEIQLNVISTSIQPGPRRCAETKRAEATYSCADNRESIGSDVNLSINDRAFHSNANGPVLL